MNNAKFIKILGGDGRLVGGQHGLVAAIDSVDADIENKCFEMHAHVETVTPDMAKSYLDRNYSGQRSLSKARVKRLVRQMQDGEWRLTHQGLAFSTSGALIDGQHRCAAIHEAGVTVKILVVRNVSEDAFCKIDQCQKSRDLSDHLKMIGVKNQRTVGGIARLCMTYLDNPQAQNLDRINSYENYEVEAFLLDNPNVAHECFLAAWPMGGLMIPSIAGMVHFVLGMVDEHDRDIFMDAVATGANMGKGDPRLLLRDRLMSEHSARDKMSRSFHIALIFKAWNLWREGKTKTILVFKSTEEMPIPH